MDMAEEKAAEERFSHNRVILLEGLLESERQNKAMYARMWAEQRDRADALEASLNWELSRPSTQEHWIG